MPVVFQSTLPLRGATWDAPTCCPSATNFNPHSPCGERLAVLFGDVASSGSQSTLPLRGATPQQQTITRHCSISIHTPLAGSDEVRQLAFGDVAISIHAPLAGATVVSDDRLVEHLISIHAPLAGSDDKVSNELRDLWISIHVPLAGSDPQPRPKNQHDANFNPRSPCGERRSSRRWA